MRLSLLLTLAAALLMQVPVASAELSAAPEPAFTKTAGNDAFFYTAQKPAAFSQYRVCFWTQHQPAGGSMVTEEGAPGGPGVSGSICTSDLPAGVSNLTEVPYTPSTVLKEGDTYALCAAAYHYNQVIWQTEPQAGGQYVFCPTTTIDRSKPTISVHLGNDAARVNAVSVPLRIDYQDAVSPPWQGDGGSASNWVCAAVYPTQCSPNQVSSVCSVAAVPTDMGHWPANRTNHFDCTLDGTDDGRYTVCAISADSAIPDNQSTAWNGSASSTTANLSAVACDDVTVDRTGPTVSPTANDTDVTTGQLVTFGASASDAAGTSGNYDWDFGDNTPHGSGAAPTHTYTTAGTYVVRATTADTLGNSGNGTLMITVTGPPIATPTPTATATGTATPSATTVATATPTATPSGPGGDHPTLGPAATLKLKAPAAVVRGHTRVRVRATVGRAGSVRVTLRRKGKRIASAAGNATAPTAIGIVLKVPRKLKPGAYQLTVVYRPAGAATVTRRLDLRVKAKR